MQLPIFRNRTYILFTHLDSSLGGFKFKTIDGEKQVSTDGGSTWENFSSGAVLLWENSAPTAAFNAKTIQLDLKNYDAVITSFIGQATWTSEHRFFTPKGTTQGCNIPVGVDSPSAVGSTLYRTVAVSDTGVDIGYALGSSSNSQTFCIPVKIYGVKMA